VARIRIDRKVRIKMGAAGLSRNAVVRLFAWVHTVLLDQANNYRHNRSPDRPGCFAARKVIVDGSSVLYCIFDVDDQTPSLLSVQDFRCERHG
jgi:hypothetical protein